MKRLFFALFASLALLVVSLPAAPPYYPIDQIKPGMVATGHTVWQGDKIEEFQVHIIGVLRNVIGPRSRSHPCQARRRSARPDRRHRRHERQPGLP